jgi:hypothetical protein
MTNDIANKILNILKTKNTVNFDYLEDSLEIDHDVFLEAVDELNGERKIGIDSTRELIWLKNKF